MKNKEYMSLKKMIDYIDKALRYTKGYTFEKFCENEEKVDATVFAISQIGELVKNISKETMEKYPNIEWIIIKNLRNKIVHDYEGIKLTFIWDIISNDLPELKEKLERIINAEKIQRISILEKKIKLQNDQCQKNLIKRYKDLEDFKNDLLKNIFIALKQAENGEVISFEDFCKEMSEKYELQEYTCTFFAIAKANIHLNFLYISIKI